MTVGEIPPLLMQGESEQLEFLDDTLDPRLYESICAFANTSGGTVVVGVKERPPGSGAELSLVGVERDRLEQLMSVLPIRFEPPAPNVRLEVIQEDDRTFGVLRVEKSPEPVRLHTGETYRRVGGSNQRPTPGVARGVGLFTVGGAAPSISDELPLDDEVKADLIPNSSTVPPPTVRGDEPEQPRTEGMLPVGGAMISARREAGDNEKTLRVEEQAEVLASVFDRASDEDAFSFGLFGPWGRGKTYLMREVAKRLSAPAFSPSDEARLTTKRYGVVHFSAWKYRRTPEVWAFLYETVLEAAKRASTLLTLRAALVRYGPWPAIVAVFGLFLTLLGVADRLEFVTVATRVLGVCGIAYYAFLLVRFKSLAQRLQKRYATVARHDDKLGLQAAIGEDLKALLIAWVPRDYFRILGRSASADPEDELPSRKVTLPAVLYAMAAGVRYHVRHSRRPLYGPSTTLNSTPYPGVPVAAVVSSPRTARHT